MPRPVVPILALPRKRSVTLSSVRLYGAMMCAEPLTTSLDVSTPRASKRVDLLEQHAEVDDDAVADDRRAARREDARRQQVQRVLLAVDDDGVPGVVAAVELDDGVDPAAEQVGRLALAFVAPLGADQNDRGHASPLSISRVQGSRRARAWSVASR